MRRVIAATLTLCFGIALHALPAWADNSQDVVTLETGGSARGKILILVPNTRVGLTNTSSAAEVE